MESSLAEVARRTDQVSAAARAELVRSVRDASAAGMTQVEIARTIGRSQPEVSRMLHFHGSSPLGRQLRLHARAVRKAVKEAGGAQVRVFGSLATGKDHVGSDIDLVFCMDEPLSLMQLGRLERKIAAIVGADVDLVPESSLKPEVRDRILSEAIAL